MADLTQQLQEAVAVAHDESKPLAIVGHGSKRVLFGDPPTGDLLNLSEHHGVVAYEPDELVLTARGGTSLKEIQQLLQRERQQLVFDPPQFLGQGTLGGAVASGCAGPNRVWGGGVRDGVLGVKLLNGYGQVLNFGGRVMKNVAGYDLSRLQAGAFGTLGVILEVSVRLRPQAAVERSFCCPLEPAEALRLMREWMRQPLPLNGLAYFDGQLHWRLAGNAAAVQAAADALSGSEIDSTLWSALRDHRHPFFAEPQPLWSLQMPPARANPAEGEWLLEWGGARRWLRGEQNKATVRELAQQLGAQLHQRGSEPYLRRGGALAMRVKEAFDPKGIFNGKWLPLHANPSES